MFSRFCGMILLIEACGVENMNLDEDIELLRDELHEVLKYQALLDTCVVELSQKLDVLLNMKNALEEVEINNEGEEDVK